MPGHITGSKREHRTGDCGENQEYVSCGSSCAATCATRFHKAENCITLCVTGCACKKGYLRNSKGICVLPEHCS